MFLFTPCACRTLQKISLGKLRRTECLSSYRLMTFKLPSDILKGIFEIMFLLPALSSANFSTSTSFEKYIFLSMKKESVVAAQRRVRAKPEKEHLSRESASLLALEYEHQNCHPEPTLHYPPPLNKQINHTVTRPQQ